MCSAKTQLRAFEQTLKSNPDKIVFQKTEYKTFFNVLKPSCSPISKKFEFSFFKFSSVFNVFLWFFVDFLPQLQDFFLKNSMGIISILFLN